jgi:protein TonB
MGGPLGAGAPGAGGGGGTAVDRVLAQRARLQERTGWGSGLGVALLLHGALAAAAILLPQVLHKPPEPLEFVPVHLIPAAALGVPNPRRAAPPPPPEPEPQAEEPAPPPEPEPEVPEDVPALPTKEPEKPAPRERAADRRDEEARPGRQPAADAPRETGSQRGAGETGERRGAPGGSSSGTTAFGSEIAGVDPDFTYGYYLDRLLSLIDANWHRPPVGDGVKAVLFFRIEKDGRVSELEVARSSGMNAFDLAALRAVQNAAPFPRLPASWRHPSLGVNLIVR